MTGNKFKLVKPSTRTFKGRKLFQIEALKDFANVCTGDLGGYVQHESNLSQRGSCWIYNDGIAMDTSRVTNSASIHGQAVVKDSALLSEFCTVQGNAVISGRGDIAGHADISENGTVSGDGAVRGFGRVEGHGSIYYLGRVEGNGCVTDHATVGGRTIISGSSSVRGSAEAMGFGEVTDNVIIDGDASLYGTYNLQDNVRITGTTVFPDTDNCINIKGNVVVDSIGIPVGMTITKTPLRIFGMGEYDIVVFDNHLQVGCIAKTFAEWEDTCTKDSKRYTSEDHEYHNSYSAVIGSIVQKHLSSIVQTTN
jgi:hypothetical protein